MRIRKKNDLELELKLLGVPCDSQGHIREVEQRESSLIDLIVHALLNRLRMDRLNEFTPYIVGLTLYRQVRN